MSETEPSPDRRLPRRVPAALIRLWPGGEPAERQDAAARFQELLAGRPGCLLLEPGLLAVLPEAADPAPFDTAVAWAHHLPWELRRRARLLILPGQVERQGDTATWGRDELADDLEARPPELAVGRVHLTGWAVNMLELPAGTRAAGTYQGPSGKSLPLLAVESALGGGRPWRNPTLLSRRPKTVPRPAAAGLLGELLTGPGLRVEGPLGCGKTRLVWETLEQQRAARLWLRAHPGRRRGPGLAVQAAHLLQPPAGATAAASGDAEAAERLLAAADTGDPAELALLLADLLRALAAETGAPLHLVCDDAEQLAEPDRALLTALLAHPALGEAFRVVLVGRGPADGAGPFEETPRLRLDPLGDSEMEHFAEQLLAGLSLPAPVRERLLAASAGFPFALEEGLVALVRGKAMRRVHGAFFFGGPPEAGYRASSRLICHLQAEAGRHEALMPMTLLAALEAAVPPTELGAAARELGAAPRPHWELPAIAGGLLVEADSPWGTAVDFACPAYAAATVAPFAEEARTKLRRLAGGLLAARSGGRAAHWHSYRLLSGTAEGIEALMHYQRSPSGEVGREELFAALIHELEAHRDRQGDLETELELLWRLLPMARRLGRLHQHEAHLARAVELAASQPRRLLALASLKAELEKESGHYKQAAATIQRALAGAQGTDPRRQALLLTQLGRLYLHQERWAEARELFTNLRTAAGRQGTTPLAATCDYHLGNIAFHEKRLEEALDHHRAALEARQEQNLARPAGSSLTALGAVSLASGNYPRALDYYRQAHETLERHGSDTDLGYTLLGLGKALSRLGDFAAAAAPLRRALALRAGRDDVAGEAHARLAVADNYLALGQPEKALEEARQAHFHLSMLSLTGALADAEQLLGRIRLSQRRLEDARRHLAAALDQHRESGDLQAAAFDQAWLVEMALVAEDEAAIRAHTAGLREAVQRLQQVELGERLELRLYRGLEWLRSRGHKVGDPLPYLDRSYREILRKASHLEPALRHRFLFQIPDNQAIVDNATAAGLTH